MPPMGTAFVRLLIIKTHVLEHLDDLLEIDSTILTDIFTVARAISVVHNGVE